MGASTATSETVSRSIANTLIELIRKSTTNCKSLAS